MLYAKLWEHPSAVATLSIVILLSAQINSSACCTVASIAISTGQHLLRLSNVLERISWPSCVPFYATNTSHRKQETFLYEYPLHWVLWLTKNTHNRTLLFSSTLLKHGRHFDYWNHPLNMCMHICYLDCLEAELCCCLVIHIENLWHLFYYYGSCFTSICDLFTDSPSYNEIGDQMELESNGFWKLSLSPSSAVDNTNEKGESCAEWSLKDPQITWRTANPLVIAVVSIEDIHSLRELFLHIVLFRILRIYCLYFYCICAGEYLGGFPHINLA
jgi:hypothetical protein